MAGRCPLRKPVLSRFENIPLRAMARPFRATSSSRVVARASFMRAARPPNHSTGGAMAKRDTASSKGNRPRAGGGQGKPNILVIWGDDIGITNLSCYSSGLMGYHTPNIDRRRATGTATTARPTSSSTTTTITIASPTRTTFASTTSATPAPGTAWDNRGTPDAGRTGRGNRHMPERAPERRTGSPA